MLPILNVNVPMWLISPFFVLLICIALFPVLMPQKWHSLYKYISIGTGSLVALFYVFQLNEYAQPIEALSEYVSFISLLVLLYVASGGMYLFIDIPSNAISNVVFLFLAAICSNIIGTTGASILLIRPYMRLNRFRLQAYHVVFFIFIVSNMGGMLTPIADPPLFIGFLKGIPFTWTLNNLFLIWLTGLGLCLLAFAYFDTKNKKYNDLASEIEYTGKVFFQGKRNLFWLGLAVFSVFLDPAIFPNIPSVQYHEKSFSFVRELIQLGAAYVCYQTANRKAIENNNFNFEPIVEVVFLFFGIFLSMMPLVEYLEQMAHQEGMQAELSTGLFFGFTGLFSSVLDNAPTYLSMFTLLMSANGYSVHSVQDVQLFLAGNQSILLAAISVAAVVFGAMTYIGNGPNLMVKSIAEQSGLKMPSFGAYILRFSLPILLPIFAVIYLLFFR